MVNIATFLVIILRWIGLILPDVLARDNFKSSAGAWFIETAAPNHITGNRSLMSDLRPVDTYIVYTAGGTGMMVHGIGAVNTERVVIPDVWYVPGINANFVSVGQLAQLDLSTEFRRGVCSVTRGSDGSVVGKGYQGSNGLYEVEFIKVPLN